MIRLLNLNDYKDYLELLRQLTTVGEVTRGNFYEFVNSQSLLGNKFPNYKVYVYELDNRIIGCVTAIIEQKLSHSYKRVMHIEDVITHSDYRGNNIATNLLNHSKEMALETNCYKIILDCNDNNIPFYEKAGYEITGTQMSIRL